MAKLLVRSGILLVCVFIFSYFISNRENHTKSDVSLFSNHAMTIPYRILIGKALTDEERNSIQNIIQESFQEVNDHYNRWNPDSELSQLNKMEAGETRKISPKLENLLLRTQELVKITEGRFDPTIEPLQNLWKDSFEQGIIPSDEAIQQIGQAVGWKNIHIENGEFHKDHDLTSLDLGGIAKGYLIDLMVDKLNAAGYPDVLVEWGGELKATGKHPTGRSWNIFISNLDDTTPEHALDEMPLENEAIATSGDYQQFWIMRSAAGEEVIYFHIINPFTFRPLISKMGSIASVSVSAKDCTMADALATAGMMFDSLENAQDWASGIQRQYPDLVFWFVAR